MTTVYANDDAYSRDNVRVDEDGKIAFVDRGLHRT